MNKNQIENDYNVKELLEKIQQQENTILELEKSLEKEKKDNKMLRQEVENLKKENIILQNQLKNKQDKSEPTNIQYIESENKNNKLIEYEISYDNKTANIEIVYQKKESQKYVKTLDIKTTLNKIGYLTNSKVNENVLIEAQLNNKEEYIKINKEINETCFKLMNEPLAPKQYLNKITTLGTNIKNKIIYEAYNKPDEFISLKEAEKAKMNTTLFIEGILAKVLIENNVIVLIEKTTKNNDLALTLLQLISSGEIFQKIISVTYDYGEEKNIKIISNEEEKNKFINLKKKELSLTLNIPKEKIEITNLRYGTLKGNIITKDYELTEEDLIKIAKDKAIINIEFRSLLEGCIISPSMFDPNGDRNSGWGINQSRGPPHHLQKYHPPLGWNGYGLRVSKQYDNGNDTWLNYNNVEGEWYIAYHGTGKLNVPKQIIEGGFRRGDRQMYKNSKNMNPLSQNEFPKCGDGVYLTPIIKEAQSYSIGIKYGDCKYYLVFMCRVNPYKVRFVEKSHPPYWIVSGDLINDQNAKKYSDEIRPYRILLKKEN